MVCGAFLHRLFRWSYGFWLFDLQTIHQPFKLLLGKAFDLILIVRPFITAGSGQTFIEKDNAFLLPVDRLDPVFLSAADNIHFIQNRYIS